MKIIMCTVDTGEDAASFSGAITRAFEKDKSVNIGYYTESADGRFNVLPLDGDLYLIHGHIKTNLDVIKHLSSKRIMFFGNRRAGSYNAPLDSVQLRLTGSYGSDHGNLTQMQLKAIIDRIRLIRTMPKTQYHISPNGKLAGIWHPKYPDGTPDDIENYAKPSEPSDPVDVLIAETHAPRICTATTIEGCFYGVYPNWYKYFDDERCTHLDFFVYVATKYNPSEFMDTEAIIDNKLVYDAHLSHECNIFGDATMILLPYKVRYPKPKASAFTDRKKHNWIHPYDDVTEAEMYHSPKVEYKWIRP